MGGYKEYKIFDILKRKSVIIRYIFFIVLIFIVTTMLILEITKESKTKDIVYTEDSSLDYKVYLKENDFFGERYLGKDNQYIASLIDYIEADFKYELEASEQNIDYKYTYKIVAEVNVEDNKNHNSLYSFKDELIEGKEYSASTSSKLKIHEPVKIDYNRYNDIINRFIDKYDLASVESTVTINMYVNLLDSINESNQENTPAITMSIPLTTKTIAIDFESNLVNSKEINVCTKINSEKYLFVAIILFVLDIILIVKLIIFIKDTKDEKAVYNMRLRKIMSNYGSYIQKLNNEFVFGDYQILEIKSFEDLLQVRETINKPILMTEKTSAMETYFFIPSDNNVVYIYELKTGNLRRNKGKRYKVEDIEEINKKRIEEIGMTKIIEKDEEEITI